jgi:Protein of unknown function (DUF5818)
MTRHLIFVLALLLSATWLEAQRQDIGSLPPSQGKTETVQGCLQGSNGNYTLTDSSGNVYRLLDHSNLLGEHVGHEVRVSGPTQVVNNATAESEAAPAGSSAIDVKHVKHISKTCTSGK